MNKLIATLLLSAAAVSAHAGDIFTAPNKVQGLMVLTDQNTGQYWDCTKARGYLIYSTNESGKVASEGCWYGDGPWVVVYWSNSNGSPSRYPQDQFDVTEYGKRELARRRAARGEI